MGMVGSIPRGAVVARKCQRLSIPFMGGRKGRLIMLCVALIFVGLAPSAPVVAQPVAASPIQVSPASLDFGDQPVGAPSAPRTVTVTNTSDQQIVITGWAGSVGAFDNFQLALAGSAGPRCAFRDNGVQLRPREVCSFGVIFKPTKLGGLSSEIYLNNAPSGTPPLTVRGVGVAPVGAPGVAIDATSLRFDLREVATTSAAKAMTISNPGDVPLTIRGIRITGRDAAAFAQSNTCGNSVAGGASCTVSVTYTPSATGFQFATLDIDSNAPGSPHTVNLSGEGTTPGACFGGITGFCTDPRFFAHWQAHGGLAINGYPISDIRFERLEDGKFYPVQYFERVRMEYHREETDPQYQVQLGQFGRLIHPADPPVAAQPGMTYFEQTGHNVPSDFAAFWTANGGLAQFGFPLSEVFRETLEDGKEYEVQYFERARFERHPEFAAPNDLQLGQFGRRILGGR